MHASKGVEKEKQEEEDAKRSCHRLIIICRLGFFAAGLG